MKETIYTIPINEAFESRCGCPLCKLRDDLEEKSIDYITGAAMMEPDVRTDTNRLGFCSAHYRMMLAKKNRLSIALMLESRLDTLMKITEEANSRKAAEHLLESSASCFVCRRIDEYMQYYYQNIFHMWKNEEAFREILGKQPYFCLPHAAELLSRGGKALSKKEFHLFSAELLRLEQQMITALRGSVSTFCQSFDYRFAGQELGDAKTSVERAVAFLSGGQAEDLA